eukprot:m.134781 g.134781  ORF g.134781 m.134781 type:complete len:107 (+) comp22548_c1_seq1:3388-3708(+)
MPVIKRFPPRERNGAQRKKNHLSSSCPSRSHCGREPLMVGCTSSGVGPSPCTFEAKRMHPVEVATASSLREWCVLIEETFGMTIWATFTPSELALLWSRTAPSPKL